MQPEFVDRLGVKMKALRNFGRRHRRLTMVYDLGMTTRICRKCGIEKPLSEYYERKGTEYVRYQCKVCANSARRYNMVSTMLSNARQRAKSKGLMFDLDTKFLLAMKEAQSNRCALTGWELDWDHTKSGRRVCPPNRASLDRIDSSGGYTRDNVQLVADMVNRVKSAYSQELFVDMCVKVSERLHLPKNS